MATKVESIRPGGAFESSFAEYPLPDLLLGILRGNLTGAVEIALGPEPRNLIFFKDGVPVSVTLPDLGVSLAQILADQGELPRDRAQEVARAAERGRRSESNVIFENELLPQGALEQGRRARAREQVVRLFDIFRSPFRFVEGIAQPNDAVLTILQPLPILFEGMRRSRDRRVLERFVEEHRKNAFRLAPTYPRGVDPFEWGPKVESVVIELTTPATLADLESRGLECRIAEATLASLHFVGMVEVAHEVRSGARPGPFIPFGAVDASKDPRVPGASKSSSGTASREAQEPSGLVVVRRSQVSADAKREVRVEAAPADARPMNRMAAALSPLMSRSYYELLRVPEAPARDQLDRAYRLALRNVKEPDPEAQQSIAALYEEAFEVLSDPALELRYRSLVEKGASSIGAREQRQAFEAERKLPRALASMIEGRIEEAEFLVEWIEKLEPGRIDRRILRGVLAFYRAPYGIRPVEGKALRSQLVAEMTRAPGSERLELYARLLALEEDGALRRDGGALDRIRQLLRRP